MSGIARTMVTVVLGKSPERLYPGEWRTRLCAALVGVVFAMIAGSWLTAT